MDCTNKLKVIVGDLTIGMHGENFSYLFSGARGGMESLCRDGMEWLYRTSAPTFWRALTDNDRGNRFAHRSGMWMSADCFVKCVGIIASIDDAPVAIPPSPANNVYGGPVYADRASITFVYETITVPSTQVHVTYEVTPDGDIHVRVHYFGKEELPELPVFGMRFIMPTCADRYRYEGLSGETYPDRMAGGVPGVYEIKGLPVTQYLVPQDCNVHMDTKWVEVYRSTTLNNADKEKKEMGIRFGAEDGGNFAFSCIPYTSLELENATHQEELPPARRTVLSILGAVRGVGGIDSWGADVEASYHIDAAKDIEYGFWISKRREK